MPPQSAVPKASATPGEGSQGAGTGTSHLPWHLIPSFKPGDDINEYTRRLEFLANVWPTEHLAQLAPRACLQAEGAAFQKLVRLDPNKLKVQSLDGIKLVVSTLGGTWGQSKTEHKYERFERAIYSTIQKSDETYSSYVARHEVQYEDMLALGATLEEMRAYILLRNSGLDPDDKKRIIVDAQGTLEYSKIVSAIQLLGSRFFGEVQSGSSKASVRTKNYDVNHVDIFDEEAHHVGFEIPSHEEPDEEQIIDVLLAEGDEDALILQQFEEALIDSLQGDPDIAACLNTYVEARRKLQDKARSRGFWNSSKGSQGFKGKGRGGKNKGGFQQNFGKRRLPLAQRILNSNCAICHQRGHWKAECPNRDRSDSSQKQSAPSSAFAGVTLSMVEEGDAYHDPTMPPPEEAFAFMAATQDIVRDRLLCRINPKYHQNHEDNRVRDLTPQVHKGISRIDWGKFKNKIQSLTRMNQPHRSDPLIQSDMIGSTKVPVEQAYFVSEGSLGIVDLGASLSVIGQSQFDDLCKHLPKVVLQTMKEAPCQVRFRFGNDSSVTGNRAIFFPVGPYWIKVIVVPSNTPFLIANSVFRALGAVIDTEEATVYFKKLQCRLPIQLSERRLYRLDLVQLLTCCPPENQKADAPNHEQTACVQSVSSHEDKEPISQQGKTNQRNLIAVPNTESLKESNRPVKSSTMSQLDVNSISRSATSPEDFPHCVCQHGPVLGQDLLRATVRTSQGCDIQGERRSKSGDHHEDDLRRAQGREDRLRNGSQGPSLCRDDPGEPLPHLVHSDFQRQPQAQPCQVSSIHPTICGEPREESQNRKIQESEHAWCQEQDDASRTSRDRRRTVVGGGELRGLGSNSRGESTQSGDDANARPHAANGELTSSSGRTFEPRAEPHQSVFSLMTHPSVTETSTVDATQQALLLQSWSLMNEASHVIDPDDLVYEGEFIQYCRENNWVAQEMWDYMRTKGVSDNSSRGRQIRSELIEVYCSQESQLTESLRKMNCDAERFGLKQGDLSTASGRRCLYDRLLLKQPRHIWMSPRCKAWCRWNQFNMTKTPELANRIMKDRLEDIVHLLLCDALFQFQQWRHPECHAHLEQPDGSHMVYQSELQDVVEQTLRAKCDMCVAGQLRNPITGELLRKSTQVLTTSRLMHDMLEFLRCSRDHKHGLIEGSVVTKKFGRINLSQYTELYTRQFAHRLARCMLSSAHRCEHHYQTDDFALTGSSNTDLAAPEVKRRRLEEKQTPTLAYQRLERENQVAKLVEMARGLAPRVGKAWFSEGPLISKAQELFPQQLIKGVELCKGADRRRVPPNHLTAESAPLRLTIGEHRNQTGNFWDDNWETWTGRSRRSLIQSCPPARMLITLFGAHRIHQPPISPTDDSKQFEEPEAKRHCVHQDKKFDSAESTPETQCDLSEKFHGPAFLKLSSTQRQQLIRMHNNLGHPDSQLLGNVLKDQGWEPEAIEGIKDMHCPSCVSTTKPKISRPSHLTNPREFNELITVDGVEWTSSQGTQYYFYHILDSGTNFQTAFRSAQRTSFQVIQMNKHWIQWAGPPKQIMTDSAGEFCSEEFAKYLQSQNILSTVIPTEAHWQMGKCERHGAIIQGMLNKYQIEHPITCESDFDNALSLIITAKNSLSRHRGYSPEILVLGKSRHTPACVSNDEEEATDWMDPLGTDPEMQWFRENLLKREAARRAFITADHDQRLRRAYLRRSRPSRGSHQPGDHIMFWREGKGNLPGQWHGPARVIVQEGDNTIWISHMSRLYRCAPEHTRSLNSLESERIPTEDPLVLGNPDIRNGVFQYHDLTRQEVNSPIPSTDSPNAEHPPAQTETVPNLVNPPNNTPEANPDNNGSQSEEQPDSEPDNPGQEGIINNPEQVPIPNDPFSDAEEEAILFCTQYDHWKIENDSLVRYHVELRNRMFCPSNVCDCPIPLSELSPERTTFVQPTHGTGWTISDTWNEVTSQQILPTPWTGKTIIPIKQPDVPAPQNLSTYQAYQNCEAFQGYEIALTLEHFEIEQCSKISYEDQIAFLASAAKRQRAEVKEKQLSEADRQLFLKAKHKEITSWLSTETVRRIARSQIPEDQILRSRWVLTWKPIDSSGTETEGSQYKPKARLVILGFEDPHIETLSRDAPTMGKDSRMLILQYAASSRWTLRSFDIQTAFLRGSRQDGRILGMEPPEEMRQHMNLKPWECCELLKSAYGLVNAPLLWYEELKTSLLNLGFIVSPLDPCVFVLPKEQDNGIHGLVGIHVDDGIGAGDQYFQQSIAKLEQKFPFGSKKEGCFIFTGIQLTQRTDGSIELDQKKYIEDIPSIEVPRDRRKFPEANVTDHERQSLRGLIGSVQYGATNTRPDLSAKLSFLQAKITIAKVQDLLDANKLLNEAKAHKETKIIIKSIPLEDLRFVSFSDASFATRSNSQSQKGCLIMAASKQIGNWQASEASPLIWYSKKISRVVASTLASEAYALSGSVDLLTWVRLHWSWICSPHDRWKQPEQCLRQCPEAYAVVDCKSLYDLIQKTTIPTCQEYRTMLEALIIKDRIKEGIVIKWVHSAAQLADCLTKCMDNTSLRQFLAAGRCIIHDVDEILKVRADNRARKQWRDQQWMSGSHVNGDSKSEKT